MKLFDTYGPGVIPSIEVYEDFFTDKVVHMEKVPSGGVGFKGHHSVLAAGYRFEGCEIRILIQNWWNRKQFFETSIDYLREHFASILFVETPQTHIPSQFPTNAGIYFTNQNDRLSNVEMTDGKTY